MAVFGYLALSGLNVYLTIKMSYTRYDYAIATSKAAPDGYVDISIRET